MSTTVWPHQCPGRARRFQCARIQNQFPCGWRFHNQATTIFRLRPGQRLCVLHPAIRRRHQSFFWTTIQTQPRQLRAQRLAHSTQPWCQTASTPSGSPLTMSPTMLTSITFTHREVCFDHLPCRSYRSQCRGRIQTRCPDFRYWHGFRSVLQRLSPEWAEGVNPSSGWSSGEVIEE